MDFQDADSSIKMFFKINYVIYLSIIMKLIIQSNKYSLICIKILYFYIQLTTIL